MDSQHRHELAENELAHWLEDLVERVKPFATLIVIGVIGVVVLFTAWGYYRDQTTSSKAADWSLFTSTTLEGVPDMGTLETVSAELDGAGAPADFASITWAEGKLHEGAESVLVDREKATAAIDAARQEFDRLLLAKGVSQEVRDRARFGLARSHELDGDFEKAIEGYKQATGAFVSLAEARVEALSDPAAQDDLRWLATAESPANAMPFGAGLPGQAPAFAPDDLEMEVAEESDAPESDVTLDDLLQSYESEEGEGEAEEGDAQMSGEATDTEAADTEAPEAEAEQADAEAGEEAESAEE